MITDYIHLFFIDWRKLALRSDNKPEALETGYVDAWIKAYLYAFSQPKNTLSLSFIKDIHKLAMSFQNQSISGCVSAHPTSYSLKFVQRESTEIKKKLAHYNASKEGLTAFINSWFLTENPLHRLSIAEGQPEISKPLFGKKNQCYYLNNTILPPDTAFQNVLSSLFTTLENNMDLIMETDPNAGDLVNRREKVFELLIHYFFKKMRKANQDEHRLFLIIQIIQKMVQLHAFADGNMRTFYILLNKLLVENNLGFTLLGNMHQFQFCSLPELTALVKRGQHDFTKLLQYANGSLYLNLKNNKELFRAQNFEIPKLKLEGDEHLMEDFITRILKQPISKQHNTCFASINADSEAQNDLSSSRCYLQLKDF